MQRGEIVVIIIDQGLLIKDKGGLRSEVVAGFVNIGGIVDHILSISWRPVLVVEETEVLGENHRPWASNW
jgi:hypothetical protein